MGEKVKEVFIIIIISIIIGGNCTVFFPQIARSHIKYSRNMKKINELDVKILALKEQIDEYSKKVGELNDPYYIERIGRDKLKMVKEGEKIYKLVK